MKIFSFCYFLVYIIFTTNDVTTKSLYDSSFRARNNDELKQYPIKRKAINQDQPYFVATRDDDPYADSTFTNADNPQPLQRYRRVEDTKPQSSLEKQLDLKRSTLVGADKRSDRLYKRDLNMRPQRHDENYGIVYGNGRPIGILEPFPQAYEFAPFFSAREGVEEIDPLVPPLRRSVMDILYPTDSRLSANALVNDWSDNSETNLQEAAKYNDEKYPGILNDFKIDNRLSNTNAYARDTKEIEKEAKFAKNPDKREMKTNLKSETVKRSPISITNEKIAELKSALNRIQNPGPSDKVTEIEDNLHDILSDMGLVDDGDDKNMDSMKNKREIKSSDEQVKRETDKEDENLEEGLNRIEITKANHDVNKRESKSEKKDSEIDKTKNINVIDTSASKLKDDDGLSENNNLESNDLRVGEDSPSSLKSISQNDVLDNEENQNHIDVKRSTSTLTVTNYQNEGDAYIRSKRQESKNENNDLMKGLEKSGDLTVSGNKSPLASSGNEADVDKKRNKDQTTEKVKREQNELEYQKQIEQNIQSKIDAIKEQVKREIEALKAKEVSSNKQETQRKKRDTVNTLIEEENSALDPQEHPEEKLMPHIRRRRNLEDDSLKTRKRIKRGLPDFSNLNNIDTGDYLDLTGRRQIRNDRDSVNDYQLDTQENRYFPEESLQNLKNSDVGKEKRDTNAQNTNTKIEDSVASNQLEEKKPMFSDTTENEAQLKGDTNLASERNHNQMAQKRSVDDTDNQKFSDLGEIVNTVQKNENREADREKKDAREEEMKQKENAQSGEEDFNKKESRSKSSDSTGLEATANLDVKLKAEQNTEESSVTHRKRRQVDEENAQNQPNIYNRRNKRASAVMPYAKSAFFPYRAEDEEADDEGDEFDEDSFEDHSALQKRDVYNPRQYRRSLDYQRLRDYDYPSANNNYQPEKRSLANKYVANMNADVYENPNNYLYNPSAYVRRKRQDNIEQLAAIHGGGPMLHHLAAVRERNIQNLNDDNLRSKRNFRKSGQNSGNQIMKEEPENIADLSDTDLFGALPQSYDGNNLLRIKRVKREAILNKTTEVSSKEKQGAG